MIESESQFTLDLIRIGMMCKLGLSLYMYLADIFVLQLAICVPSQMFSEKELFCSLYTLLFIQYAHKCRKTLNPDSNSIQHPCTTFGVLSDEVTCIFFNHVTKAAVFM